MIVLDGGHRAATRPRLQQPRQFASLPHPRLYVLLLLLLLLHCGHAAAGGTPTPPALNSTFLAQIGLTMHSGGRAATPQGGGDPRTGPWSPLMCGNLYYDSTRMQLRYDLALPGGFQLFYYFYQPTLVRDLPSVATRLLPPFRSFPPPPPSPRSS